MFDADGVLWHGDVSEDFTLWMIGEGHFDGQLWPVYERCNREDPAEGALQILNFYRGLSAGEIDEHVECFWKTGAPRLWVEAVRATIQWATEQGFTVFVVSASPAPVLRPLTRYLPVDQVFGLELAFDDAGLATGQPDGVVTTGTGKAERVRMESRLSVHLAVGDSCLDVPMMRLSSGVAWAINPDDVLREVAEREQWLVTTETPE